MIKKVLKTIEKYKLLDRKDRVVVAVSGGPDSTALLFALAQQVSLLDISILVAHYNHGLRGTDSDSDEKHSQKLATELGLIFVTEKMDSGLREKGVSPEDFYRRQRYRFLNKVAEDFGAQKIALGHNIQDQAETVLLNLFRGSGLDGLKGILPMRDGRYIRPLIEVSRSEITAFLRDAGISCCQDSSNASGIYLRNKVRSELIPCLQEKYNPKIVENLAQVAEILRQDNDYISNSVKQALKSKHIQSKPDEISLNIGHLRGLAQAVRSRLFKEVLESMCLEKNGVSFRHIMALERLAQAVKSGRRISLPHGIKAKREYEKLVITRNNAGLRQVDCEYQINIPGKIHIKEFNRTISMEIVLRDKIDLRSKGKVYLDLDKIKQPVVVRNRRDGDRFQPLGMKGRQKIKSLFINQKIPRDTRDGVMLLVDQDSVVWIENMHLSDRVKISPQTKNVLCLEIN